jgi:hypothetical protein
MEIPFFERGSVLNGSYSGSSQLREVRKSDETQTAVYISTIGSGRDRTAGKGFRARYRNLPTNSDD